MNLPRKIMTASFLVPGLAFLIAGCAVGPDYRAPQAQIPKKWEDSFATTPNVNQIPLEHWWTALSDPQLDRLISDAVTANYDLRLASARLRESRAALGLAESAQGLQVDAVGSIERNRISDYRTQGFAPTYNTVYRAGFDAGWEIDLFGGTRRGIEAADAELAASAATVRDVQVSVTAEVVVIYLDLAAATERLDLARKTVANQQSAHDLAAARFNAGLIAGSLLAESEAQIAQAEALIPALEAARSQALIRLGILTGRHVDEIQTAIMIPAQIPQPVDVLNLPMPSDLLTRRPDIIVAERNLAAATARIGQAKAEWFPRFSLTGTFGYEANNNNALISSGSQFWSIGPSVRWPILSAGRIRANVNAADARSEQAALRYEQTLLIAFGEVEINLVALAREQQRLLSLTTALTAQERSLAIAQERFTRGLDDFEDVLRSQRLQINLQDQVVLSRRAVGQNLAALAKALGGGWQPIVASR
jgi:NodT family efflux transporter outer membrane factor (OMF) lipoprotein